MFDVISGMVLVNHVIYTNLNLVHPTLRAHSVPKICLSRMYVWGMFLGCPY
jgi:hypothetical protein